MKFGPYRPDVDSEFPQSGPDMRTPYKDYFGDGRHLYARCATKLCHIIRRAPFGAATLADDDVRVDFSAVTTPTDRVAVVATAPLTTNETWTPGRPGELWVFDGGQLRATLPSRHAPATFSAAPP